ncbi:MAG: hypothetical protein E7523_00170 [Ruminococcaceae bacterium]|nr:hypothetical protein [Oscillospiraceae bacterium]
MRKMISVLMCFALLLSCCTFAVADDSPQLAVVAYRDNTAWIGSDVHEDYVCFDILASNCEQLESFELLITYNPAVLEYSAHYPFLLDEIVRNSIDCTVTEPGKLCVIGTNDGYGADFDPFCCKVIGEGDTEVAVALVSFRGADGEIENVVLETSIENFTAGDESAVLQLINDHATADGTQYSRFNLAVENCGALESFELLVHYNPDVLDYSSIYPFLKIAEKLNSIDCTLIQPGLMRIIGTNDSDFLQDYKYLHMGFEPFCFKVIGSGNTDISVELVSFRTADGEVEDVVLDASIDNFTATVAFVEYDLTGDSLVTAEDARLALRFAVGLDTATDAQCRAAAVSTTNEFTADIARTILRCSVGLEP